MNCQKYSGKIVKIKAAEEKEQKRIKCEEKRKQREAERHQVITEQKKAECEVKG